MPSKAQEIGSESRAEPRVKPGGGSWRAAESEAFPERTAGARSGRQAAILVHSDLARSTKLSLEQCLTAAAERARARARSSRIMRIADASAVGDGGAGILTTQSEGRYDDGPDAVTTAGTPARMTSRRLPEVSLQVGCLTSTATDSLLIQP